MIEPEDSSKGLGRRKSSSKLSKRSKRPQKALESKKRKRGD